MKKGKTDDSSLNKALNSLNEPVETKATTPEPKI